MLRERKEALKAEGKKGFTLMEMLIVIAIIAILIAIAIPVFTTQLERAGEATDAANIRAEYAEVMTEYITNGNVTTTHEVNMQQSQNGWQNDDIKSGLSNIATTDTKGLKVQFGSDGNGIDNVVGKGKATFNFDKDNNTLSITFGN